MSQHPQMTEYLAGARWFAGKGRDYDVVDVQRVATLPGPPTVTIDILTVRYAAGGVEERYQMPLSHYPEEQERIGHAHVGTATHDDLGFTHAYDAVHDREAMAVYLDAFAATPDDSTREYGGLTFHRVGGHVLDTQAHSTLFSGEQSNSSVAFGEDSLLKVFRKVTSGRNPDIEIHKVLTEAENHNVASLYGWIEAGEDDLGMIQQFLRTASDGWDLALASVRNLFAEADLHAAEVGGDFAGEAERLGGAVADVHAILREHFPTGTVDASSVASRMREQYESWRVQVPALEPYAAIVNAIFDRLEGLGTEVVQRVHGDLHLGQTLRTSVGWKLVDFEGEPAKPLSERVLPDSPWRDVAGMLRSFDYAARSVEKDFAPVTKDQSEQLAFRSAEWAARNRDAFLSGYVGGRRLSPEETVLVAAYEADKAIYEVGYEARNRPAWIEIPLAALANLDEQQAEETT